MGAQEQDSEANEELETEEEETEIVDEDIFTRILDLIDDLLRENVVAIISQPGNVSIGISSKFLERKFPNIEKTDITNTIDFMSNYFHYLHRYDLDNYFEIFDEEDREKVKKLIEIMKSHKNSLLIEFRIFRKINQPFGELESHKKIIETESLRMKYYDIQIPYINNESNIDLFRLELDRIELEQLIASLVKLIEE